MKIIAIFFLIISSFALYPNEMNCKNQIKKAICLVNPPAKEADRYRPNRPCILADTSAYEVQIIEAYDLFPNFVQMQFCKVKFLYIETNFFGSAWSAPINENAPDEMLLGLNKQELDSELRLESYLTWFEQLSFGGLLNHKPLPHLPSIYILPNKWVKKSFLIDTLLHEVGHLIDYKNRYNQFECTSQTSCTPKTGSW